MTNLEELDKRIIYWDWFEEKFITSSELDINAPPERYTYVECNIFDTYLETWAVHNCMNICIAYTQEYADNIGVNLIRQNMARNNNVTLKRMLRWYIPKKRYDKILEDQNG